MSFPKNAPLRRRLMVLAMTCSIVALLATTVALGAYDWFYYRKNIFTHLTTMASITARNSAASLAFSNPDDARHVLAALEAEPIITAAALYDVNGHKFASYRRPDAVESTPALAPE